MANSTEWGNGSSSSWLHKSAYGITCGNRENAAKHLAPPALRGEVGDAQGLRVRGKRPPPPAEAGGVVNACLTPDLFPHAG